jgi:hypothetical protein
MLVMNEATRASVLNAATTKANLTSALSVVMNAQAKQASVD